MKNINLYLKAAGVALIVIVLAVYNGAAVKRDRLIKEHEKKVAEIDAHNAAVLQAQNEQSNEQSNETFKYSDGEFTGTARGFGGDITVNVTIENHAITAIEIVSADKEDKAYLMRAKKAIDSILSAQSADVDAISGATFSSNGIKNAVSDALTKAEG